MGDRAGWICAVFAGLLFAAAGNIYADPVSGAAFLKIPIAARPAAMGEAYTAALDDLNSMIYNPAGLSTLKERQAGLMHADWLENTTLDFIGAAVPTHVGTIGVGMTRLAASVSDGRDQNRQAASGFQNSDTAYTLSYGGHVPAALLESGRTHLGGNLKLLESRIGSYSARTFAVDLGIVHEFDGRPISVGASLLNLGKGMTFLSQTDALPLTVSAGAAYRVGGALNLALDVARDVYDQKSELRIGSEYALFPALSLRMGYASAQSGALARQGSNGPSALAGLAMGLGMRLGKWSVDYNFSPMAQLGNVQRISLGARF